MPSDEGRVTVVATLRIMAKSLDPDEVSSLLAMAPDESHRCGDPRADKAGRTRHAPYSEGIWQLRSGVTSSDVEAHLVDIIERLKGKEGVVLDLQARGYRVDIFLGIIGIEGNYGFSVSNTSLQSLNRLGVSVGFDLYAKTS